MKRCEILKQSIAIMTVIEGSDDKCHGNSIEKSFSNLKEHAHVINVRTHLAKFKTMIYCRA